MTNYSKYSHFLKDLADKKQSLALDGKTGKAAKKAATQDKDEAGRASKKRKREGLAPKKAPPAPGTASATGATAKPTTAQPANSSDHGPSSGLSQNANGSEHNGRRAREEFVSETLKSAVDGQASAPLEGTNPGEAPQPSNPTAGQPILEDTEMANRSDEYDDSDDELEGETAGETAYLRQLKTLYAQHSDKATQQALLAVLEKLSEESNARQGQGGKNKRRTGRDSPWDQDEDYHCTDGPRRRGERRTALSGYTRLILGQLLGVKNAKSLLPHGPPPEVAAPTAAAFHIKWNESERSEFNAIAARIVALQVVKDYPSLCELDKMHDIATMHIKYLRARYRRQTNPEYIAKEPQRLRAASANTRKRTLYTQRLRVIDAVPALRRHGRLFETLGLEGTSSDEEDRNNRGVYLIKRKKQLARPVEDLKRQVDQVFKILFKGPGTKGNQVRTRVESNLISTRRFRVKGLPLSCMNPTWLASLTDIQKQMYEFRDMEYQFTFPMEMLKSPETW
ncbi:hypothetical protein FRC09_020542 [Ceratobasidium sp. 395]|nr:hypothetical protein FRC09_020542 [Ceratobasidium sp. 395]